MWVKSRDINWDSRQSQITVSAKFSSIFTECTFSISISPQSCHRENYFSFSCAYENVWDFRVRKVAKTFPRSPLLSTKTKNFSQSCQARQAHSKKIGHRTFWGWRNRFHSKNSHHTIFLSSIARESSSRLPCVLPGFPPPQLPPSPSSAQNNKNCINFLCNRSP